jgi:phage baseplate assembly protein W
MYRRWQNMDPYIGIESDGFTPEEFADIKLCLETLLSVQEGTQPLDRNFGINLDDVAGYPINVAQNMLALEIIEKVGIYEPRVEVSSVDFESNTDGQIIPHIYFIKAEV